MSNNTSPKRPSDYLKYSSLAFQFLGAIILGVLIGKWLDKKFETSLPVFTALVSLFFVIASLFLVIRDILKNK